MFGWFPIFWLLGPISVILCAVLELLVPRLCNICRRVFRLVVFLRFVSRGSFGLLVEALLRQRLLLPLLLLFILFWLWAAAASCCVLEIRRFLLRFGCALCWNLWQRVRSSGSASFWGLNPYEFWETWGRMQPLDILGGSRHHRCTGGETGARYSGLLPSIG